ncbi:MAG TPA: 16S rRNA (guanine(527)-N(7))-methyltransferase RsmG [Actinomycetales bacterium]|nr:16S rRNA (guanine(527)-N(7))-methyltransferase RsmG [Actinomycetales bacterium]
MEHDGGRPARTPPPPPAPPAAADVFGSALPTAERFVEHLSSTGISWGLVGPREVPRLWDRHVLNCAVVSDLLSPDARVIDIGSGAGLPGLTIALRRPDLRVLLVEPLLRRATWLEQIVADLELGNVTVRRARAEELHGGERGDYVTARAVASLDRLAGWALPLLRPGGQLLALKGRSAEEEVARTAAAVEAAGGVATEVVSVGQGLVDPPVTVVRVTAGSRPLRSTSGSSAASPARRRRRPRPARRPPAG